MLKKRFKRIIAVMISTIFMFGNVVYADNSVDAGETESVDVSTDSISIYEDSGNEVSMNGLSEETPLTDEEALISEEAPLSNENGSDNDIEQEPLYRNGYLRKWRDI